MDKRYFVYILWFQKDGSRYVGQTNNLKRRIKQHHTKKSNYTSKKGSFKLIWIEFFKSRLEARKREKFLKSRSGRRYLTKLNI